MNTRKSQNRWKSLENQPEKLILSINRPSPIIAYPKKPNSLLGRFMMKGFSRRRIGSPPQTLPSSLCRIYLTWRWLTRVGSARKLKKFKKVYGSQSRFYKKITDEEITRAMSPHGILQDLKLPQISKTLESVEIIRKPAWKTLADTRSWLSQWVSWVLYTQDGRCEDPNDTRCKMVAYRQLGDWDGQQHFRECTVFNRLKPEDQRGLCHSKGETRNPKAAPNIASLTPTFLLFQSRLFDSFKSRLFDSFKSRLFPEWPLLKRCPDAPERKPLIEGMVVDSNFNNDPFLKEFGLRVNPKMLYTTSLLDDLGLFKWVIIKPIL